MDQEHVGEEEQQNEGRSNNTLTRDSQQTKAVVNQYSLISDCFVVLCFSMSAGSMTLVRHTHLHVSGFVCHHKGGGETVLVV